VTLSLTDSSVDSIEALFPPPPQRLLIGQLLPRFGLGEVKLLVWMGGQTCIAQWHIGYCLLGRFGFNYIEPSHHYDAAKLPSGFSEAPFGKNEPIFDTTSPRVINVKARIWTTEGRSPFSTYA